MRQNMQRDTATTFPCFKVGDPVVLVNPRHVERLGARGTIKRAIKSRRTYDVKLEDGKCYEAFEESLARDYSAYVASLLLLNALWWFIEERDGLDAAQANAIFFSLRERYRLAHPA